jgi:hypothetical protein
VLADARRPESADDVGAGRDAWCDQRVYRFGPRGAEESTLRDVLAHSDELYIVRPELREPDCSGIGHIHVSFVPIDEELGRLQRAYRSQTVPAMLPDPAPLYLMGAHHVSPRRVDLNKVCVSFRETITMEVDWILPIADAAQAPAIQAKLDGGACGRPPPGCERCSTDCGDDAPGCCELYEDSCPGPDGDASTCAGFMPCDPKCCPG